MSGPSTCGSLPGNIQETAVMPLEVICPGEITGKFVRISRSTSLLGIAEVIVNVMETGDNLVLFCSIVPTVMTMSIQ